MQAQPDSLDVDASQAQTTDALMATSPGKPLWRSLLEIATALGIIVIVVNLLLVVAEVNDGGMNPTFRQGQRLLVSRLPYLLTPPQRGDIVAVRNRIDPSQWEVRRVIGVPGDALDIKGAQVSVDGRTLNEPYQGESLERVGVSPLTTGQYRLGENQYFLLNDNRADLDDSRSYGLSSLEDIVGRAWLVVWPFENIASVTHERPVPDAQ